MRPAINRKRGKKEGKEKEEERNLLDLMRMITQMRRRDDGMKKDEKERNSEREKQREIVRGGEREK